MAVICDIDDTLLTQSEGEPMQNTIKYLKTLEGPIFIVTGRTETKRAETILELKAAGIEYNELIMNPKRGYDAQYKYEVAKKLSSIHNISVAIENNPKERAAYERAGIRAIDPATT
jgi:hypothetical protein